ncbi:MAG: hypothetical protein HQK52_02080 [Oligoflexia bacterium]|nr:hypothetical protein [Oligoflexia bacterium]
MSFLNDYPAFAGFLKFAILATLGEIIARLVTTGRLTLRGIHLGERALAWGFIGYVLSFVIPIYSAGIDKLAALDRLILLPMAPELSLAFWKSFWINALFGLPLMIFHRVTDTFIDNRAFLRLGGWPFSQTLIAVDWKNICRKVAPTLVWFWLPAHTITFMLSPEYRVFMAALLSICLGMILALMKPRSN